MKRTPSEVAAILRAFLEGTASEHDWDDFTSISLADSHLEAIRVRCAGLHEEFPPERPGHYCSAHGLAVIRGYAEEIESAVEQ